MKRLERPKVTWRRTYFPLHSENRMIQEGNTRSAREYFLKLRPSNLEALLKSRYSWMNQYIGDSKKIYELGCGAGFLREFVYSPYLILTDISNQDWVDEYLDATALPFADESIDIFICSHMIHHLAYPSRFLKQASKALKPGGCILIAEINTSLVMKLMLRIMRHEGWSYEVDVFDESTIANQPSDPWSANCAIPEMLFRDSNKFEEFIPSLAVERNDLCEFLLFPLSGGVIAKTRTINLPRFILRFIKHIDSLLIRILPNIFACGRLVVLRKRNVC